MHEKTDDIIRFRRGKKKPSDLFLFIRIQPKNTEENQARTVKPRIGPISGETNIAATTTTELFVARPTVRKKQKKKGGIGRNNLEKAEGMRIHRVNFKRASLETANSIRKEAKRGRKILITSCNNRCKYDIGREIIREFCIDSNPT